MHRLIYVSFILFFVQQILFANHPLVQFGVGVVIFIFCIIQGVSILKKLKDMELDIWGCLFWIIQIALSFYLFLTI